MSSDISPYRSFTEFQIILLHSVFVLSPLSVLFCIKWYQCLNITLIEKSSKATIYGVPVARGKKSPLEYCSSVKYVIPLVHLTKK